MKKIHIAMGIANILLLSACSHQNPMSVMPREDVGKFLAQASNQAERLLHVPHAQGRMYEQCLFKAKKIAVDCQVLYQNILAYAGRTPQFQAITRADLMDVKNFYRVKEDYNAAILNILPEN